MHLIVCLLVSLTVNFLIASLFWEVESYTTDVMMGMDLAVRQPSLLRLIRQLAGESTLKLLILLLIFNIIQISNLTLINNQNGDTSGIIQRIDK